jgi:hypothetical protein
MKAEDLQGIGGCIEALPKAQQDHVARVFEETRRTNDSRD